MVSTSIEAIWTPGAAEAFAQGCDHYYGRGVPLNYEKAAELFKRASYLGHPSAKYKLGVMLLDGKGVRKNTAEAVREIRSSAEAGFMEAQVLLSSLYQNGLGVPKDLIAADKWFAKASELSSNPCAASDVNEQEDVRCEVARAPEPGYGFIYVLRNPSMPNVFKVGRTTNSVRQRIGELGSTGVPRPFEQLKVFEIEAEYLSAAEKKAHELLKPFHHGKEFFEGDVATITQGVEDAIFQVTKSASIDLVGQAAHRAIVQKRRQQVEQLKREDSEWILQFKEQTLAAINAEIDKQRAEFVRLVKANQTFYERHIATDTGAVLYGCLGIFCSLPFGPLGLFFLVPLITLWMIKTSLTYDEWQPWRDAAKQFPYKNLEDIDTFA